MTDDAQKHTTDTAGTGDPSTPPDARLLVEDVLLLLFQPDSGSIAGENILYYVLGGAVLADLTLNEQVQAVDSGLFSTRVHAVGQTPPADEILASAWSYIAEKPRGVQTALAAIGPYLREPVLNRLIERGDLDSNARKILGIFPSTRLTLGSDRRQQLLDRVRAALIDGEEPEPLVAASIALLSASGTLSWFYREIPWSSEVYTRGKEFEQGNWGAAAAASAVARTMAAAISNAVVAAAIVPRT